MIGQDVMILWVSAGWKGWNYWTWGKAWHDDIQRNWTAQMFAGCLLLLQTNKVMLKRTNFCQRIALRILIKRQTGYYEGSLAWYWEMLPAEKNKLGYKSHSLWHKMTKLQDLKIHANVRGNAGWHHWNGEKVMFALLAGLPSAGCSLVICWPIFKI